MKVVKEITVALPNKPGSLAKLCTLLAQAKVNIQALCVVESTDVSVVRLVADKPAAALKAIEQAGLCPATKEVLTLSLPNKPGALAKACAKIAARRRNIDYVYGSATGTGKSTIVLAAGTAAGAKKVLGRGF